MTPAMPTTSDQIAEVLSFAVICFVFAVAYSLLLWYLS